MYIYLKIFILNPIKDNDYLFRYGKILFLPKLIITLRNTTLSSALLISSRWGAIILMIMMIILIIIMIPHLAGPAPGREEVHHHQLPAGGLQLGLEVGQVLDSVNHLEKGFLLYLKSLFPVTILLCVLLCHFHRITRQLFVINYSHVRKFTQCCLVQNRVNNDGK